MSLRYGLRSLDSAQGRKMEETNRDGRKAIERCRSMARLSDCLVGHGEPEGGLSRYLQRPGKGVKQKDAEIATAKSKQ